MNGRRRPPWLLTGVICLASQGAWAQDSGETARQAPTGLSILFAGGWPGFLIMSLLFILSLTTTHLSGLILISVVGWLTSWLP